jgi:hypothetical protein
MQQAGDSPALAERTATRRKELSDETTLSLRRNDERSCVRTEAARPKPAKGTALNTPADGERSRNATVGTARRSKASAEPAP